MSDINVVLNENRDNITAIVSDDTDNVQFVVTFGAAGVGLTDPTTTRGDLIYRDTYDVVRLPLGTVGQVLTSDGTDAAWKTPNYEQSFSSQSVVIVDHNLGRKPSVTVVDSAGDECEGDIVWDSENSLTLTFSAPFSGLVICN